MLRFTIRNDDGWAPLREDLDYIRKFLTIHYYRNGRDVSARLDIDPAAMDVPVMKLSIQPYIENATKYVRSPNMTVDQIKLTVKVSLQENHLEVDIQDTGTGMPPDVLRRIRQLIAEQGESKDPYSGRIPAYATPSSGCSSSTAAKRRSSRASPARERGSGSGFHPDGRMAKSHCAMKRQIGSPERRSVRDCLCHKFSGVPGGYLTVLTHVPLSAEAMMASEIT
ncbi:ATP-binding protein [Paenibacillus sp. LC231]|uniref:sensor histidine kinase n=1 Tax=Paenibacillus sp. LC231 TaxID=1120679 RepID=UPI001392480A|nr:ATP-binding protein [Paenibacillus sp. LC231]